MSEHSNIEWTDTTWNPVLGCDKVSAGCKGCYAIRTAWRLQHNPNPKVAKAFEGLAKIEGGKPNWTGRINFIPERLADPLGWSKPRKVFVNSQSDLFHDGVEDFQIDAVFAVMAQAHQHTFQVLTKRPERMLAYFKKLQAAADEHAPKTVTGKFLPSDVLNIRNLARNPHSANAFKADWPLPNVWLGVSCENQATADERIPLLLQTPAAVRWVSAEPLLGEVILPRLSHNPDSTGLNWVVAGGESGPDARPMHPDWARSLRDQCKAAGVPFFFKQWGEWAHGSDWHKEQICMYADERHCDFTQEAILEEEKRSGIEHRLRGGTVMSKLGKKAAGRKLDGVEHNEYPSF
jgi:protein gp37